MLATLQLSVAVALPVLAVSVLQLAVTFTGHMIVGLIVSFTVTVAVVVDTLPLWSVTVRVTVFAPTFEQSKLFGATLSVCIPQASLEPLSTSAAVMLAAPAAFSWIVMFLANATGATLSCTVTVDVVVDTLPLWSVTVRVTVLAPTFAQLKLFGDTLSDWIPQASLEPLS